MFQICSLNFRMMQQNTNLHSKPSIKQARFQSLIWDSEFPAQSHCAYLNSVLLQYTGRFYTVSSSCHWDGPQAELNKGFPQTYDKLENKQNQHLNHRDA